LLNDKVPFKDLPNSVNKTEIDMPCIIFVKVDELQTLYMQELKSSFQQKI
jgi:hypothetical protein